MSDNADSKTTNDGDGRLSDFDYPEGSYGAELEQLEEAFAEIGQAFYEALGPLVSVMEYLAEEEARIDAMPFHKRIYTRIRRTLRL